MNQGRIWPNRCTHSAWDYWININYCTHRYSALTLAQCNRHQHYKVNTHSIDTVANLHASLSPGICRDTATILSIANIIVQCSLHRNIKYVYDVAVLRHRPTAWAGNPPFLMAVQTLLRCGQRESSIHTWKGSCYRKLWLPLQPASRALCRTVQDCTSATR